MADPEPKAAEAETEEPEAQQTAEAEAAPEAAESAEPAAAAEATDGADEEADAVEAADEVAATPRKKAGSGKSLVGQLNAVLSLLILGFLGFSGAEVFQYARRVDSGVKSSNGSGTDAKTYEPRVIGDILQSASQNPIFKPINFNDEMVVLPPKNNNTVVQSRPKVQMDALVKDLDFRMRYGSSAGLVGVVVDKSKGTLYRLKQGDILPVGGRELLVEAVQGDRVIVNVGGRKLEIK